MAQAQHGFQELQETAEALINLISSSKAENKIRLVRDDTQTFFEQHMETKATVTEILKDLAYTEERVGQRLVDLQAHKSQREQDLDRLEEQLRQYTARSQTMDAEQQFLQRELESLRNSEQELQSLQEDVDEDTTEVIPSAIHVAQLYHKVTKIKWEHDTEPHILKGVHYGTDLATPINIDTTLQSRCEVSDHLWGLVSAEW